MTKDEISMYINELIEEGLLKNISRELGQDVSNKRQVELYLICRHLKPEIVVETGVENGISTTFILAALDKNIKGILYSIEVLERLPDGRKVGWLVPSDMRKRWRLIIGNSLETLPQLLEKIRLIDIFIHDSEHSYQVMMGEYIAAWPHIKLGGLLISDDTGRNEAFIDFCKMNKRKPLWTRRGYGILKK